MHALSRPQGLPACLCCGQPPASSLAAFQPQRRAYGTLTHVPNRTPHGGIGLRGGNLRDQRSPLQQRASAPAAAGAAATAATAAGATYFSAASWATGTAVALGVYLLYWFGLATLMPKGAPVTNMQDKHTQPGLYHLLLAVIVGTLVPVFVLPWLGMAVSGAWRAGLTYFLPVMVQLLVNIAIELRCARAGRVLAVYASTVGNNIARLVFPLAALYDMSHLGAPAAAAAATAATGPYAALWWVAVIQLASFVGVMLVMVPAAISTLPVVLAQPMGEAALTATS